MSYCIWVHVVAFLPFFTKQRNFYDLFASLGNGALSEWESALKGKTLLLRGQIFELTSIVKGGENETGSCFP